MSRTPRALLAALLAAVLLGGCGLPLEGGVRSPGQVAADAVEPGDIQKLPPGPQVDAGPRAVVLGFLNAQSNPDDGHAIARQFLDPSIRDVWDDRGVSVRDPASLEVQADPADESAVVVRADVRARIAADGSYVLEQDRPQETYRLRRDETGQLRLVDVPDGLLLTPIDASRSFRPRDVYFLRETGRIGALPRLVPDRVFLPVEAEPVDALVRRLLAGPSAALTGAVTSAYPEGTALQRPVSTADGVVTVDLTAPAAQTSPEARRHLSAQLVWTLRGAGLGFTTLRLLVDGQPLDVEGAGSVQDRNDWAAYDPARMDTGPLLYVQAGRLATLDSTLPPSEVTDGRLPVTAGVLAPGSRTAALLSSGQAGDVLRTGPLPGPFADVLARGPVGSMSWGPGDQGLWVVVGGAEPEVLLVLDASTGGGLFPVPYSRPPGAGPLASLQVSRDGARVAAVFGEGPGRQLWIGRVERSTEGTRIGGLRPVAPALADVADVSWESGTSLVALGTFGTANRLPVRLTVDGSELEAVRTPGLDGEPEAVTASPGRPLVVGTRRGDAQVLFVEQGGLFREREEPGAQPAYPG